MLSTYRQLEKLAFLEFGNIVIGSTYLGGTAASPNKLRILISDGSTFGSPLEAITPTIGSTAGKVDISSAGIMHHITTRSRHTHTTSMQEPKETYLQAISIKNRRWRYDEFSPSSASGSADGRFEEV